MEILSKEEFTGVFGNVYDAKDEIENAIHQIATKHHAKIKCSVEIDNIEDDFNKRMFVSFETTANPS